MFTPLQQIPDLEMFSVGSGRDVIKNLEGPIRLECWGGFRGRRYADEAPYVTPVSDGLSRLFIGGDLPESEPTVRPSQVNAYNFIIENQLEIQQIILQAILTEYRKLQQQHCFGTNGMADVQQIDQFKKMIGLAGIHLLNIDLDEIAYVGYEFGCTWDAEYGLGVMTHKTRVVEIGDASTSFLSEIALRDSNPPVPGTVPDRHHFGEPAASKPWWKFW